MKKMKKLLLLITLVAGVIAFALPAQATTLTFELDYEFSGPEAGVTSPESLSTPWITAIFDDSYGTGYEVELTMSATNLTGTEFIEQWLFNFDPEDNTGLTFAQLNTTAFSTNATRRLAEGDTTFKPDGDGFFDFKFDFPTSKNTFTASETVIYKITYTSLITVSDFNIGSIGGDKGSLFSAAHIQSIYDPNYLDDNDDPVENNTEGSGWIADGDGGFLEGQDDPPPIPEPATMLLLGSGLIGFAVRGKKRFKKRNG